MDKNVTISALLKKRCTRINMAMHNHGNMKNIKEGDLDRILLSIHQHFDEIENLISPYVSGGIK